jgi:hypothetical protein
VQNGTFTRNIASVHRSPKIEEEEEIEILSPEQIAELRAKLQGHTLLGFRPPPPIRDNATINLELTQRD